MRREVDGHARSSRKRKLLLDLGQMAMVADAVRREPLSCLREQDVLLQRATGARDSRLGIDDDVLARYELRLDRRQQRQQHRGRIAAGTSNDARGLDLVAVMLGQPV